MQFSTLDDTPKRRLCRIRRFFQRILFAVSFHSRKTKADADGRIVKITFHIFEIRLEHAYATQYATFITYEMRVIIIITTTTATTEKFRLRRGACDKFHDKLPSLRRDF
jgi:hypothetical protein